MDLAGTQNHTSARLAAGAAIFDGLNQVMLVHPIYKDYWDIPGGYVESGESPRNACEREITEELGLRMQVGALLVVDWAPHPDEGDKLLFVFDGGRLSKDQETTIRLQSEELDSYSFHPGTELNRRLIPRLARRLTAAIAAREAGRVAYLENGYEGVPSTR